MEVSLPLIEFAANGGELVTHLKVEVAGSGTGLGDSRLFLRVSVVSHANHWRKNVFVVNKQCFLQQLSAFLVRSLFQA